MLMRWILMGGAVVATIAIVEWVVRWQCGGIPVIAYGGALVAGVGAGEASWAWLRDPTQGTMRRMAGLGLAAVILIGMTAAAWMTIAQPRLEQPALFPPSWHSKCAHRYCSQVLAPWVLRSPWWRDQVDCAALHLCANEAELSDAQVLRLDKRLKTGACPMP